MCTGAYQGNVKMKRARASSAKHRSSQLLYNKLTELVSLLSELTDIQELTDTIILQVRDISMPAGTLNTLRKGRN